MEINGNGWIGLDSIPSYLVKIVVINEKALQMFKIHFINGFDDCN